MNAAPQFANDVKTVSTHSPAAQSAGMRGADAKKVKTPAPLCKARPQLKQATSAAQGCLAFGFEIGQRVKVINTADLPLMLRKYAAKYAVVKKVLPGDEGYTVTFRGKKGGIADFRPEELGLAA